MKQTPYKITELILTTYSGEKVTIPVHSEVITKSKKAMGEEILDALASTLRSPDPFVAVRLKTVPLFADNSN